MKQSFLSSGDLNGTGNAFDNVEMNQDDGKSMNTMNSMQMLEKATEQINLLNDAHNATNSSNTKYKAFTNQLYTAYTNQHKLNEEMHGHYCTLE